MKTEKPAAKKRVRPYLKQRRLLNHIFNDGRTVEQALRDLRIRPSSLARWLNDPKFKKELDVRLARFRLESFIEQARCAPSAEGEGDPFCGIQP